MSSAEFQILNRKLDRVLALLTPVPPKVRQLVDEHDLDERERARKIQQIHRKRQWQTMFPDTPEKRAVRRARDEATWQELLADGTVTAEDRAFVDRIEAEHEREEAQ